MVELSENSLHNLLYEAFCQLVGSWHAMPSPMLITGSNSSGTPRVMIVLSLSLPSPLVSRSKSAASMVSAKETLAAVPSLSEGDSQLDSPPPAPAPAPPTVGEEPRAPPPLHPPLVTLLDFGSLHFGLVGFETEMRITSNILIELVHQRNDSLYY